MRQLGYQTQYTDPTTGDTLMQSRWYSPGTGTFRSRDTFSGNLNTPVSLNRYTYAHNNPIRYSDPSGRCVELWVPECAVNPLTMSNSVAVNGSPTSATDLIFPETLRPTEVGALDGVVIYEVGAGEGSLGPASADAAFLVQLETMNPDGSAGTRWELFSRRSLDAGAGASSALAWSQAVSSASVVSQDERGGLDAWVSPVIAAAALHQAREGSLSLAGSVAGLKIDREFIAFLDDVATRPSLADERSLYYFDVAMGARSRYADDVARLGALSVRVR